MDGLVYGTRAVPVRVNCEVVCIVCGCCVCTGPGPVDLLVEVTLETSIRSVLSVRARRAGQQAAGNEDVWLCLAGDSRKNTGLESRDTRKRHRGERRGQQRRRVALVRRSGKGHA